MQASTYPCPSPTPTIPAFLDLRDISTPSLTTSISMASNTTKPVHLTSTQVLAGEFWPYGAGVLILSGACLLIFLAIWLLDKTYELKEFGLTLLVWVWGMWWSLLFWPFQMLGKVSRLLDRGMGRERDGNGRVIRRVQAEMEEC